MEYEEKHPFEVVDHRRPRDRLWERTAKLMN